MKYPTPPRGPGLWLNRLLFLPPVLAVQAVADWRRERQERRR